jgi:hypothetical protein
MDFEFTKALEICTRKFAASRREALNQSVSGDQRHDEEASQVAIGVV